MVLSLNTMNYLQIGQLAERTGLSRKALRLYETRGLLVPDAHSESGYRLYGAAALARLTEIVVLKRAGFTLAHIATLLERSGSATALIEARIVALRRELEARATALAALEHAWQQLDSATKPDIEQLMENIQMSEKLDMHGSAEDAEQMTRRGEILGKHFTPEEREHLRQRAAQYGKANMQHYGQQWPPLIAAVRAAMDAGTPADDPAVIDLARRWHALVDAFSGGDATLSSKMKDAYEREPQVMQAQGMDEAMFAYVGKAMRAEGFAPDSARQPPDR